MSSIKDIVDVDVELFASQAYRRSGGAAQHQSSRPLAAPSSEKPAALADHINIGQTSIKRRRSNRVSKPASQRIAARRGMARRRSGAVEDGRHPTSGHKAAASNPESLSKSPGYASRGLAAGMPVKYTPVTRRVSRAKKGMPVHTCGICRPVKTFTRAEHLRRHQLSHQKPAYPCSFEDCERAFHRPDLLARHVNRHETQGERPYRSGDLPSSRASSTDSQRRTPDLKVEPPAQGARGYVQTSTAYALTSRTSRSGESSMTVAGFSIIPGVTGSLHAGNFSSTSPGNPRAASQAHLPEPETYPTTSPPPSSRGSFDQFPDQDAFAGSDAHQAFDEPYGMASSSPFPNYTAAPPQPLLPLLRIPEESWTAGLSYSNTRSPWCSSASDSAYSTQSACPRDGPRLAPRDRSQSIATGPDRPLSMETRWLSHGIRTTHPEIRSPAACEPALDRREAHAPFASPRTSSPMSARQLLDLPNSYGGLFMDMVGNPALSTHSRPLAQNSPAYPSRTSTPELGSTRGEKDLVEPDQLSTLLLTTTTAPAMLQPQPQPQPDIDIDLYLCSYWQDFHSLFPIVHQPTFGLLEHKLLRCAMAAIGTQYHHSAEARARGSELNEYCKTAIERCPNWDLHTMQAILLTDIFASSRGRDTNLRFSRHFEDLYSRVTLGGCPRRSPRNLNFNGPNNDSEEAPRLSRQRKQRSMPAKFSHRSFPRPLYSRPTALRILRSAAYPISGVLTSPPLSAGLAGTDTRAANPATERPALAPAGAHLLGIKAVDADGTLLSSNLRFRVLARTCGMLELRTEELLTSRASMKGEMAEITDALRYGLEAGSVGYQSGLRFDATGVLANTRKDGGWKCFSSISTRLVSRTVPNPRISLLRPALWV
ncbi:unnamed protein product [Diplocarpon coronariae]